MFLLTRFKRLAFDGFFLSLCSVLRECPALVRLQMRAVGLGCHDDHIYVDLRPLIPGRERAYVMVWEDGDTGYCDDVMKLQKNMIEGNLKSEETGCLSLRWWFDAASHLI